MKQFKVGKLYGTGDASIPPIRILKRTAKMVQVENADGVVWRMRIRVDQYGQEYVTESTVPAKWRECFRFSTIYEEE